MAIDRNQLHWNNGPDVIEEVLTDLEQLANLEHDPGLSYRTASNPRNVIELNAGKFYEGWHKPDVVPAIGIDPSTTIICSTIAPQFYMCHLSGLCYYSPPDDSGIRTFTASKIPIYWGAFVYNFERFGDSVDRLAKLMWGPQVQVGVPSADLINAAFDRNRVAWDRNWLQGRPPFINPVKDMSAFDAQLMALLGPARARNILKEIA